MIKNNKSIKVAHTQMGNFKKENKLISDNPIYNFIHQTSNSAITLIALIITIIVLLILAGVTLSMVMGESGIIKKAQLAKEKTNEAQINEEKQLQDLEKNMNTIYRTGTNTENKKILFDGEQNNGTITFKDNKISDFEYYEFIFGMDKGNSDARLFSQIVSREYLQMPLEQGAYMHIQGAGGATAFNTIQIYSVTDNSISFNVGVSRIFMGRSKCIYL